MSTITKFIVMLFFAVSSIQNGFSQTIEAAYSEWDNHLDEWKIHVNEDLYVEAIRQSGTNPYGRWNLIYEQEDRLDRGYIQMKWAADFNYFDFFLGGEQLSISTIYRNDPTVWKIQHGEQTLIIENKNVFEWGKRSSRNFDWVMYQVDEREVQNWYIDDNSQDELTFEMRVAATLIVIETFAFLQY